MYIAQIDGLMNAEEYRQVLINYSPFPLQRA